MSEEKSFEERMDRLEKIVAALESQDITLEEGMKLYQEGAVCSRACRQMLEKARHELEVWKGEYEADPAKAAGDCEGEPF